MFDHWILAPYNSFSILQCLFLSICLLCCVLRKLQQVRHTDTACYLFLRKSKRVPHPCLQGFCIPPHIQRCPQICRIWYTTIRISHVTQSLGDSPFALLQSLRHCRYACCQCLDDREATGKRQGSDRGPKVPKKRQGGDREATGWRQGREAARI